MQQSELISELDSEMFRFSHDARTEEGLRVYLTHPSFMEISGDPLTKDTLGIWFKSDQGRRVMVGWTTVDLFRKVVGR